MSAYDDIKASLETLATRLAEAAHPENRKALFSVEQKLKEETFNLVVLGQFKRGKSTFINALLGADVLPTAIVPLTSVVTILRYGQEKKAVVKFLDDTDIETNLANLSAYITEREAPFPTQRDACCSSPMARPIASRAKPMVDTPTSVLKLMPRRWKTSSSGIATGEFRNMAICHRPMHYDNGAYRFDGLYDTHWVDVASGWSNIEVETVIHALCGDYNDRNNERAHDYARYAIDIKTAFP